MLVLCYCISFHHFNVYVENFPSYVPLYLYVSWCHSLSDLNKETTYLLTYLLEYYVIFFNKLTLLMMTAVIWSCVFNLFGFRHVRHTHSTVLLLCFLFKVYKRFYGSFNVFLRFFTFFYSFWTFLHLRLKTCSTLKHVPPTVSEYTGHSGDTDWL